MLKTALNMKGLNPNNGINLCDWVKLGLLEKKEKMRLTFFPTMFLNAFCIGVVKTPDSVIKGKPSTTNSREISISCKNLFLNRCKINMFKLN